MKISKKQVFSFIFLLTLSFSFLPFSFASPSALAQSRSETNLFANQEGMNEISTVYGGKRPEDIRIVAAKFIRLILSFLGIIFLALIIAAGFKWMTSGGNEEEVKKARKLMINAAIGLIIVLVSWSIAHYLIYVFNKIILEQSVDLYNL